MINIWNTIKGYVAGAVALIACPCHLPITLPLLIALTAGTALGNWLAGNFLLVFILSSAFFIAGLVLAWKWLGAEPAPTTRAPTRKRPSTDLTITLVTSSACKSCVQARQVWQQISQAAFHRKPKCTGIE